VHTRSATRHVPGLKLVEHRFAVPLRPDAAEPTIEVFAREVRAAKHADEPRPYLLKLNGGPGFANQRPRRAGAWLERALQDFHVILLDQRGTGLSTPLNAQTLAHVGDAAARAEYASHFRADAIVRDAEHVRRALLGDEPWTILGQSFGGFCALTYLSFAPEGVRAALVTGGLPSLHRPATDVYRALGGRLDAMLDRYLTRYPDDRERWEAVLDHVATTEERTPRGRTLTPDGVRIAGREVGMSTGPEQLHYLVEGAFASSGRLSTAFLESLDSRITFAVEPLYAILHEPIYAKGEATRWAAQRVLDERPDGPPLLFGETIHPSMFAEDPSLVPLRETAELLAAKSDWNPLYDREILRANTVPAVAAVYLDDLYVESSFSLETVDAVGNLRAWVTNEHDHDGIHVGPVLDRLLEMLRGEA
jgi:pimeloyl-ACP methyl ester carboxylesterase